MVGGRPTPKYVLLPGYVTSKKDGDEHYVSSSQLLSLYRVRAEECVTFDWERASDQGYYQGHKWKLDLLPLKPDYHGRYKLPIWPFPIVIGKIPK